MTTPFPINDPDMVWAEMERLVGVADMNNGERHLFEELFRTVMAIAYAPRAEQRKRFQNKVAFTLYDLLKLEA